ncbi:MAG: hypothetical protein AAGD14_06565 [Planctomycetota bacterium]
MRNGALALVFVLTLGAAVLMAQEEPKPTAAPQRAEVKVTLKAGAAGDAARVGYSKPRPIAVESNAPRFLFEIPKFKAQDPIYFRVSMGETKGVPFYGAIDRSGKTDYHDLLYLDFDRDLDLTNDGKPTEARIRTIYTTGATLVEFLSIGMKLPFTTFGKEGTEPYTAVLFYVTEGKKVPKTVQIERDGWREGTVKLGDGEYRLVLLDDDSDGQYTTSDSWALKPVATALGEMLSLDASRTMLFPCWSTDEKTNIEVKAVEASGREITLVTKPAKETETAFFTRIARQRQSPEERALDIDPLRPKATSNQKVDWITGRNAEYALEIAASPNVKKPVLLFFASNRNRMSVQMEQYTFRDREVVTLAKRFVCARIDAANFPKDMKKYRVDRVPMILFLTSTGTRIHGSGPGFIQPRNLAAAMKRALR